jgi:hypothetical protein
LKCVCPIEKAVAWLRGYTDVYREYRKDGQTWNGSVNHLGVIAITTIIDWMRGDKICLVALNRIVLAQGDLHLHDYYSELSDKRE